MRNRIVTCEIFKCEKKKPLINANTNFCKYPNIRLNLVCAAIYIKKWFLLVRGSARKKKQELCNRNKHRRQVQATSTGNSTKNKKRWREKKRYSTDENSYAGEKKKKHPVYFPFLLSYFIHHTTNLSNSVWRLKKIKTQRESWIKEKQHGKTRFKNKGREKGLFDR